MKVFTLVRVDIKRPYDNFLNIREVTELSVIGTYPDRETAEDEMMWRIQNDFDYVLKELRSQFGDDKTAALWFDKWVRDRFDNDSKWSISNGSRMYMLRIQETEL